MVSFDLKSGYHHVEIHEDHQCFLGSSWKFRNGVTRYIVFYSRLAFWPFFR